VQVSEQDAGLPLADVETGQRPQMLCVTAVVADGDMHA
jgi:hypothetical protein